MGMRQGQVAGGVPWRGCGAEQYSGGKGSDRVWLCCTRKPNRHVSLY